MTAEVKTVAAALVGMAHAARELPEQCEVDNARGMVQWLVAHGCVGEAAGAALHAQVQEAIVQATVLRGEAPRHLRAAANVVALSRRASFASSDAEGALRMLAWLHTAQMISADIASRVFDEIRNAARAAR